MTNRKAKDQMNKAKDLPSTPRPRLDLKRDQQTRLIAIPPDGCKKNLLMEVRKKIENPTNMKNSTTAQQSPNM